MRERNACGQHCEIIVMVWMCISKQNENVYQLKGECYTALEINSSLFTVTCIIVCKLVHFHLDKSRLLLVVQASPVVMICDETHSVFVCAQHNTDQHLKW